MLISLLTSQQNAHNTFCFAWCLVVNVVFCHFIRKHLHSVLKCGRIFT